MAAALRRTDSPLGESLINAPWEFDFFQAVRLLALLNPDRRAISRFREPLLEGIRFSANLSISFPASLIQNISIDEDEPDFVRMTVNFMGLTGPAGILPVHYTEYLMARYIAGDHAAEAFFNLFNHRLISLFYLSWEKHHFPVAYEQQSLQSRKSAFTSYLFDLIGMGTAGLQNRLSISDSVLLSYSGLIAQRPHSAIALQSTLRDYFQVPVKIEQFVGKWNRLEEVDLSYLGEKTASGQLGSGAVAGQQVWNVQARFRICIGPLTWKRFQHFLPGESAIREMIVLVRHFVNQSLGFEVRCSLLAAEVPLCSLSGDGAFPRLGLTSWLKTCPFADDPDDLAITVSASGEFGKAD